MNEKERTRRIVDDLLLYCFSNDIQKLQLDIQQDKTKVSIHLTGYCESKPSDMEKFFDALNAPRNPNLEGYYDELLGGHQEFRKTQEYRLLGMMIDEAQLRFEFPEIQLELTRFFH